MKTQTSRLVAVGIGAVMAATPFLAMAPAAQANSDGKKKLAIAGAAVAGYGLLTGRRTVAVAGAVGSALAYHSYRKDKKSEDRRKSWYQHRYGSNWQRHYHG